jgi:hypothetical protein
MSKQIEQIQTLLTQLKQNNEQEQNQYKEQIQLQKQAIDNLKNSNEILAKNENTIKIELKNTHELIKNLQNNLQNNEEKENKLKKNYEIKLQNNEKIISGNNKQRFKLI